MLGARAGAGNGPCSVPRNEESAPGERYELEVEWDSWNDRAAVSHGVPAQSIVS